MSWFGNEWHRFYQTFGEDEEDSEQRRLAEWIIGKGGSGRIRDLTHGLRRFRSDAEGAEKALQELCRAGLGEWGNCPPGLKGGKPTRFFQTVTTVTVTETPENVGNP